MKKLLTIIAVLAGVVSFTSCDSDDVEYVSTPVLKVTGADVEYASVGGNGVITLEEAATKVECESEWVTAQTSGNQINLTVAKNTGFEGRSCKVVIYAGSKQAAVTVTQKGIIYGIQGNVIQELDNKAQTVELPILHDDAVNVKSNASWIQASFDEQKSVIVIKVEKNETGWMREGTVTVTSGAQSDEITVSQFDVKDIILGDYILYYVSSATGTSYDKMLYATLTEKSLDVTLSTSAGDFVQSIPAKINFTTGHIELGPAGSYVGRYGNYYDYLVFRSVEGYWSGYTNLKDVAEGDVTLSEEDGVAYVDVEIGGVFGSRNIDALAFRAMKAEGFAEENNAGYVTSFYYPIIEKAIPLSGNAKAAKSSKIKVMR